jgi:serine/threonine protein kinase
MPTKVCGQCGKPAQEGSGTFPSSIVPENCCRCLEVEASSVSAEPEPKLGELERQPLVSNDNGPLTLSPKDDLPQIDPEGQVPKSRAQAKSHAQSESQAQTRSLKEDRQASPVEIADDKLIGKIVGGHYRILAKIGAGGMSVVYQALDIEIDQVVAIKVVSPERQLDDQVMQRLRREAQAACDLDQENIVKVREFGLDTSGHAYLVMDFVAGESLSHRLQQRQKLPAREVIQIATDICKGLSYAHKHGVVHRDIKSGNIMICHRADGKELAKIVDFGLAKSLFDKNEAQDLTKSGEVFGSPFSMSPEQCRGRKVDARSDIYSLGCVMYEALTGFPPFKGESCLDTLIKHLNEKPAPIGKIKGGQHLEAIVSHALEKLPESRYQSVDELCTDLAFELPLARLSGRLSFELPLARVLQDTLDDYGNGRYIVRLSDPESGWTGEFVISDSHVVAAQIDQPPASGYEALRTICQIGSCEYTLNELEEAEPEPVGKSLHIKLSKLIERLPYLPENQGDLFDQETLLDKVFANANMTAIPKAVREQEEPDSEQDGDKDDAAENWHKVAVKFREPAVQASPSAASGAEDGVTLESLTLPKRQESSAAKDGRVLKKSFVGPIAAVNFFFARFWRVLVPLFILFLAVRLGMMAFDKFKLADNHEPPKETRHVNAPSKRVGGTKTIRVHHAETPTQDASQPSAEPPHRHAYQTLPSSQ